MNGGQSSWRRAGVLGLLAWLLVTGVIFGLLMQIGHHFSLMNALSTGLLFAVLFGVAQAVMYLLRRNRWQP